MSKNGRFGRKKRLPKWENFEAALEGYNDMRRQLREQRAAFDEFDQLISAFLVQIIGERGEVVLDKNKLAEAMRKYHSEVIPEGDSYRVRVSDREDFINNKVKESILAEREAEAAQEKVPCHKCEVCKLDPTEEVNEA